jgi:imidazolonepropionase
LRSLSSQSLRRRAASIANGMFEHGTGMVEARAGYALDDTGVFKVLRVQNDLKEDVPVDAVSTLLLAPPMGGDPARWARHVIDSLLPNVRRRRLASFVDVEYDSEALPAPIAVHLLETAAELGFGTKLHTGFFSRRSAASLALRTNVLSISGLTAVEEDEANDLASSPVISILKPGVALQTGPGYIAPGRRLVDAGAAIAVAAGYHPELSPGYNDQLTILLATRLYRLRPEEAITAATINAAHAIRAAGTIGSIESGKQADLLILDAPDYRELANYGGVNMVAMMIKKGKVMYSKAASKSEGRGRAGVKERERKPRQ